MYKTYGNIFWLGCECGDLPGRSQVQSIVIIFDPNIEMYIHVRNQCWHHEWLKEFRNLNETKTVSSRLEWLGSTGSNYKSVSCMICFRSPYWLSAIHDANVGLWPGCNFLGWRAKIKPLIWTCILFIFSLLLMFCRLITVYFLMIIHSVFLWITSSTKRIMKVCRLYSLLWTVDFNIISGCDYPCLILQVWSD